jgi:hypothetical protein
VLWHGDRVQARSPRRQAGPGWRRPHPALAAISVDEVLDTVAELGRTARAAAA